MHGARNYPWSSRRPSTLDVDVPDGAGDEEYLRLLQDTLAQVDTLIGCRPIQKSDQTVGSSAPRLSVLAPMPSDLLVFYQAGVDPLMHDRLGRLKLTRTGLRDRNAAVLRWCEERSLPLVVTMGGGYSRPIELSARCHADVFIQAASSFVRRAELYARDCGDSESLAVW
jgi:acetoin utilization deacetylase AcuC-like enzyme